VLIMPVVAGHELQNVLRLRRRSVSISGTIEEKLLMKSRRKCVSVMGNKSCSKGSRPKRSCSIPLGARKICQAVQIY
jgi:hypothetical protein